MQLKQHNHKRAKSSFEPSLTRPQLNAYSPQMMQNIASLQCSEDDFNQFEVLETSRLQKTNLFATDSIQQLNEPKRKDSQQLHHFPTRNKRGSESLINSIINSNNTSQQTQINFIMQDNQQEKLFDSFFKQSYSTDNESKALQNPNSLCFLDFIDQQINYHAISQKFVNKGTGESHIRIKDNLLENQFLKQQVLQLTSKLQQFNQSKKELIVEYTQYKNRHEQEKNMFNQLNQENKQQKYDLQSQREEIRLLRKQKSTNNKKCEILQQLLVRERIERENNLMRLNKYYAHNNNKDFNLKKIQEMMQNMHAFKPQIVQETVSSLADEIFLSNDESRRSSLSHGSSDEKKPIQQQQKRQVQQVSKQDAPRGSMRPQFDLVSKNTKQKVSNNKFDDASNDITNNSIFSAHS